MKSLSARSASYKMYLQKSFQTKTSEPVRKPCEVLLIAHLRLRHSKPASCVENICSEVKNNFASQENYSSFQEQYKPNI